MNLSINIGENSIWRAKWFSVWAKDRRWDFYGPNTSQQN